MDYFIAFLSGAAVGAVAFMFIRRKLAAGLAASAKILGGGGPGEEGK